MRVLITGSAGMLGSALSQNLSESKVHEVLPLTRQDLDLRDKDEFLKHLKNFRPEVVIHAAAKVGGIQANIASPFEFLASNLQMDSNVITTSLENEVPSLLYIGSSCMYPKDYRQPLVESDILQGPLELTNEGYALAKITGAKLCEYATRSRGVSYKTIIPSNLYGPGDNFRTVSSHLLASVIRKVHEAKVTQSREIDVWGSGNARREFTYVADLAQWVGSQIGSMADLPSMLNVGIGVDYSVNDFYNAALRVLNVEAELIHDITRPEGMQARLMDSTQAREKHSWSPKIDLEAGIKETYKWFLSFGGEIKK